MKKNFTPKTYNLKENLKKYQCEATGTANYKLIKVTKSIYMIMKVNTHYKAKKDKYLKSNIINNKALYK